MTRKVADAVARLAHETHQERDDVVATLDECRSLMAEYPGKVVDRIAALVRAAGGKR